MSDILVALLESHSDPLCQEAAGRIKHLRELNAEMLEVLQSIIAIYDTGRGIESCRTEINAARFFIAASLWRLQ